MPRQRQKVTDAGDCKVLRRWALEDYRTKNRAVLNQKAKVSSAKTREDLKTLPLADQEAKRLQRLAHARAYRERNRELLKTKAREYRAAQYFDTYGYEKFCKSFHRKPRCPKHGNLPNTEGTSML